LKTEDLDAQDINEYKMRYTGKSQIDYFIFLKAHDIGWGVVQLI
jgi:hypothetical protein